MRSNFQSTYLAKQKSQSKKFECFWLKNYLNSDNRVSSRSQQFIVNFLLRTSNEPVARFSGRLPCFLNGSRRSTTKYFF